jgi:hypothetical protein
LLDDLGPEKGVIQFRSQQSIAARASDHAITL